MQKRKSLMNARPMVRLSFKGAPPPKGSPVFLIDRREKELTNMLRELEKDLEHFDPASVEASNIKLKLTQKEKKGSASRTARPLDMFVSRRQMKHSTRDGAALWLSATTLKSVSGKAGAKYWWWLPPVIWPGGETSVSELISRALRAGARNFVLNAPWQVSLFSSDNKKVSEELNLWAGPFCNVTNGATAGVLKGVGFSGVIASPELSKEEFLELPGQSPIPVGVVTSGQWPLVIARTLTDAIKPDQMFNSPKGEGAWVKTSGENYWIYPDWNLDISAKKEELKKAGYTLFVHMEEDVPKHVKLKERPGKWNWDIRLL